LTPTCENNDDGVILTTTPVHWRTSEEAPAPSMGRIQDFGMWAQVVYRGAAGSEERGARRRRWNVV